MAVVDSAQRSTPAFGRGRASSLTTFVSTRGAGEGIGERIGAVPARRRLEAVAFLGADAAELREGRRDGLAFRPAPRLELAERFGVDHGRNQPLTVQDLLWL